MSNQLGRVKNEDRVEEEIRPRVLKYRISFEGVQKAQAPCSVCDPHPTSANTSRIGPIIRVSGDHLLCSAKNWARICHWGSTYAGNIDLVCEGVAGGRSGVICISALHIAALVGWGSGSFGCLRWVVDAILVWAEDRARIRLAEVDRAVRVGVRRGRERVNVCSAGSERALADLRGLV